MDIARLLGNSIGRLANQLLQPVQDWLGVHLFWNSLLMHPLWLLGLIVLSLFLFAGLLGAIARLTEAIWLMILQAPIRLVQLLFVGIARLLKMPFTPRVHATGQPQVNPREQLTVILNRLEGLQQEQEQLMREVRSILAGQELVGQELASQELASQELASQETNTHLKGLTPKS